MSSVRKYRNDVGKPFTVVKWKVKTGNQLFLGSTVLTYVHHQEGNGDADDSREQKLKSSVEGKVLQLLVNEGDVAQPGSPLLDLESCTHELIIKEICAQCGSDLWRSGLCENIPQIGLKVTHEQAKQLQTDGDIHLLENRKLALLICLDEMFADDNMDSQDLFLSSTCSVQRLDLIQFLHKMSQTYDIHFYTRGDPCLMEELIEELYICDKKKMSRKVWPMESLFQPKAKPNELNLLPRGNSMVCVLEWKRIFNNEATFPAPTYNVDTATNQESNQHSIRQKRNRKKLQRKTVTTNVIRKKSYYKAVKAKMFKLIRNHSTLHWLALNRAHRMSQLSAKRGKGVDKSAMKTTDISNVTSQGNEESGASTKFDILTCLHKVLTNIHRTYYNLYDQMVRQRMYVIHQKVIPEMKNVIPYLQMNILKGVNIVFSGLIPTNVKPVDYPLWSLAESIGANISTGIIWNNERNSTTHIIAAKSGTDKCNIAKKYTKIHVVSVEWLLHSARCWERLDERFFTLKSDCKSETLTQTNSLCNRLFKLDSMILPKDGIALLEKMKEPESHSNAGRNSNKIPRKIEMLPRRLSTILNMTTEDLADMSKEVNTECTDDTDSEDSVPFIKNKSLKWNSNQKRHGHLNPKRKIRSSSALETLGSYLEVPIWERPCTSECHEASDSSCPSDYICPGDDDYWL